MDSRLMSEKGCSSIALVIRTISLHERHHSIINPLSVCTLLEMAEIAAWTLEFRFTNFAIDLIHFGFSSPRP